MPQKLAQMQERSELRRITAAFQNKAGEGRDGPAGGYYGYGAGYGYGYRNNYYRYYNSGGQGDSGRGG